MNILEKIDNYMSEAKKPGKGTLYISWSSIFDNPSNKYNIKLFSKALKAGGAKKVWTDNAFGWGNQPEVVLFTGLSELEAREALEVCPVFAKWGAIIQDAHLHWD